MPERTAGAETGRNPIIPGMRKRALNRPWNHRRIDYVGGGVRAEAIGTETPTIRPRSQFPRWGRFFGARGGATAFPICAHPVHFRAFGVFTTGPAACNTPVTLPIKPFISVEGLRSSGIDTLTGLPTR